MAPSVPFLARLMPVARAGGVRPALSPRFTPAPLAEALVEAFPFGPVGERAAAEGKKPTARPERRGDAVPVRTPQTDGGEPSVTSAFPTATSPITSPFGTDQPQIPALATVIARPPVPAAPAPGVLGQSPDQPQHGHHPTEGREAAPILSVIPISTTPGNIRPPLREAAIQERTTNPVRVAASEIHVTIDHIDVRAWASTPNQAPQPVPRPRPASTQSLADYLRQRGGGAQ